MKGQTVACAIALVMAAGHLGSPAAQTARLRHLASIYADGTGGGLRSPEGVACGLDGAIVVGDTGNDRLLRFTYRDKAVAWGSEIRTPELTAPSRVHLSSKGELYALDLKRRRIVRLDAEGAFKGPIGLADVPPPTTILVKDFGLDAEDNVYVLDAFSARVLVLSATDGFQRALAIPDEAGFGSSLSIGVAGTVLLLDSVGRQLFAAEQGAAGFAPLGGSLAGFLGTMPTSMAATKGVILVAEGPGGSILGFGRDGSFLSRHLTRGWSEGALNSPGQICVNDRDEAFVADRDNSRVQVFQLVR